MSREEFQLGRPLNDMEEGEGEGEGVHGKDGDGGKEKEFGLILRKGR